MGNKPGIRLSTLLSKTFYMNARTKILTAFIVGTTAGTLLGMLLTGEKSKLEKLNAGDGKASESFIHRLFARKHGVPREDFNQPHTENTSDYEQV